MTDRQSHASVPVRPSRPDRVGDRPTSMCAPGRGHADHQAFRTDGLGDSTYLLTHDGGGVVVDPQRDVERFERAIA